jgi:hypothetical protein
MGMNLIVERSGAGKAGISLAEWRQLLSTDAGLRERAQPYVAVNPRTGEKIQLALGEADAEFFHEDEWQPFLRYARGKLVTAYVAAFDDPLDAQRRKIAEIAAALKAVVMTDMDDAPLDW